MSNDTTARKPALDPAKFRDPDLTAKGEKRAVVALTRLKTLWFNTGSLCNLSCSGCYMESGPTNDRLAFIEAAEVSGFLDQAEHLNLPVEEVGFTGGEPFMNRQFPEMLQAVLERGLKAIVLTNATQPFRARRDMLLSLVERWRDHLTVRVSLDHYKREAHEANRGPGSWDRALESIAWLAENRVHTTIAGRTCWEEGEDRLRQGYSQLFARIGIAVDAMDGGSLVLFPEMDPERDVPEVSVHCWDLVGARPESMMCATSRMVVKRKGAAAPVVVPCTLLPYDSRFDLGHDLAASARAVALNHPYCASFCVLGGGACSI